MSTETYTTPRSRRFGYDGATMTPAHWLVAALAAVTGVIHLYLYIEQGFLPFLFAGVVFLAAIGAMLFNVYRRVVYALGIPFTAGQIVLWYVQGMPDMSIAVFDKPVQLLIVVLLAYLLWTDR